MFFGKTKKKNKPTTIEHPVLGTLIKKTDWYTKKSFIITLWDKTFTRNGAISIGLISDFSDEFLEKHIGEDVIFTDSFGMSVYPIKAVLPNEKVYYNFNNKYEGDQL